MATREELYAKFGITAEAGQLFETELGTLLLTLQTFGLGTLFTSDEREARATLEQIERSTLGRLLHNLKDHARLSQDLEQQFTSALGARNRLNHGFFEGHNYQIQTDRGRDVMMADLENLHEELFKAWQIASAMTSLALEIVPGCSDLTRPAATGEHTERSMANGKSTPTF